MELGDAEALWWQHNLLHKHSASSMGFYEKNISAILVETVITSNILQMLTKLESTRWSLCYYSKVKNKLHISDRGFL